jgi:hypothetical protein
MKTRLLPACLAAVALLCTNGYSQPNKHQRRTMSATKVRTYYLCAEEVDWDYTPDGRDVMMEREFDSYGKAFTEHTPTRIGRTYRKAVFQNIPTPRLAQKNLAPWT